MTRFKSGVVDLAKGPSVLGSLARSTISNPVLYVDSALVGGDIGAQYSPIATKQPSQVRAMRFVVSSLCVARSLFGSQDHCAIPVIWRSQTSASHQVAQHRVGLILGQIRLKDVLRLFPLARDE